MKKGSNLFLKEINNLEEKQLIEIIDLFYETIQTVNKEDYDQKQLNIWAPEEIDISKWKKRISKNYIFTACDNSKIIGFGELSPNSCIDMLYVHKDYVGQEIGKKLLNMIVRKAIELNMNEIFTEASITARPFFEAQGFKVIKKEIKTLNDVEFINFLMKKKEII
ncbi:GNAT family N-acetyltransferase [Methanobacterium sp. ACI-7]|uniref:GNAT family N-acetyltransferase n=1 Tax=unclassified Methanobacterium TaxID=2627676 RepID=UPI0039C23B11